MTAAPVRLGAGPSAREVADQALNRVMVLERQVAELRSMLVALEAQSCVEPAPPKPKVDDEDGWPHQPPGKWLRTKAAAEATGYSRSGLDKLCRQGRVTFDFEGPHRLINIDSIVRKLRKVRKTPA